MPGTQSARAAAPSSDSGAERDRFRLNHDFARGFIRSHDLIRKVCNFRDHALSLLERIDYPLGVMRSVRAFMPVFDGLWTRAKALGTAHPRGLNCRRRMIGRVESGQTRSGQSCVCPRNRNVPASSRCGRLPMTSSSRHLRSRSLRSLRNLWRSLDSLGSLCRSLCNLRNLGPLVHLAAPSRCFPCRRRRMSPG